MTMHQPEKNKEPYTVYMALVMPTITHSLTSVSMGDIFCNKV